MSASKGGLLVDPDYLRSHTLAAKATGSGLQLQETMGSAFFCCLVFDMAPDANNKRRGLKNEWRPISGRAAGA